MLLSDIYNMACAYIREDSGSADAEELRACTPSLLSGIIVANIPLDMMVTDRQSSQYPMMPCADLDDIFPLSDRLCPLCAVKLASLLCSDENTALSDRLNIEYETERQRLIDSLPAHIAPIKNVY